MSVAPATSVQNKLAMSNSVLQLGNRAATHSSTPRNATGVYVGTSDPLTVGKIKSTIPPTSRGRLGPTHFGRPVIGDKKRQGDPILTAAHVEGPKSHPDGVCPKRHQAIASADPIDFQKLTKRNPRQFTKINNNGVKHFELLRQHGVTTDHTAHLVSEETLISELNRNRTMMLGIATCFDQLNVKSFDDVKTLLPKRRSRSSPAQRAESKPGAISCRQAIGTAKLMAHLPHNAQPKLTQYLPTRAPFHKTDSQLTTPRRKDTNSDSAGSQQLSSSDLHRAGFLKGDPRAQPAISDRDVERLFAKTDLEQKKVLRENIEVPCPSAANTRPTTRDDFPHRSPFSPSVPAPPIARTNSELEAAEEEDRDKVSEMSSPMPPIRGQGRHAPPRRIQSMSQIDISVHNEDGEADTVEIDIADEEPKEEQKYIPNARRQSISDRISRRRHSELAAEIIRLSAENRRREFAELLNEHKALVLEIESGEGGSEDGGAGDSEDKCDEEENKENEQT